MLKVARRKRNVFNWAKIGQCDELHRFSVLSDSRTVCILPREWPITFVAEAETGMQIFEITNTDNAKLEAFANAFHRVYLDKGPDAELDLNAVQAVLHLAVEGLGLGARAFLATMSPLNPARPADLDSVSIVYPDDACEKVKSAAALVFSYRHPESVVASELDDAYSALAATDFGHVPSP